jgi:hypothetical protein
MRSKQKGAESSMGRKGLRSVGILGALTCAFAGQAGAQEYCVSCTGPAAVYRCIIEGAKPGGAQPLQLLCVTTIAKEGAHASCSVKGGTVFACDGQIKRLSWSALNPPADQPGHEKAERPPAKAEAEKTETGKADAKPGEKAPPQTMVDLAKRANEQAAEQMKKANENMKEQAKSFGDATKKTWECVTSLFTRCGG